MAESIGYVPNSASDGSVFKSQGSGCSVAYAIVDNTIIRLRTYNPGGAVYGGRGFVEVTFSDIPADATITAVHLHIKTRISSGSRDTKIRQMQNRRSTYSDAETFWTALAAGTLYYQGDMRSSDTWYDIDLGSDAITELSGHRTWFHVALTHNEASPDGDDDYQDMRTYETGDTPHVVVTYTPASTSKKSITCHFGD